MPGRDGCSLPPSRATDSDSALIRLLTSTLAEADPNPGQLFTSSALLASLCLSTSHAATLSAYIAHHRLLLILGRLYHRQSGLVVQRVQALMERGQRRLLEDMWADEGQQAWQLEEATGEAGTILSDRQQLLLLARLQTVVETVIRGGRHTPRQKAACDLCNTASLFSALVAAVVSLWNSLLTLCQHSSSGFMGDRVRSVSLAALSLLYEATYKSKQQARGGTTEVVGHISVMSQLLDPSSASAASFYPLLQTVVEQLRQWLPQSPLMCSSVLGSVATAVLEIGIAQRQKAEQHVDALSTRSAASEPATQPCLDLSPLMHALLAAAIECARTVQVSSASAEWVDRVDSCMQATLEAHTYFFRNSSQSDVSALPAFLLQTCSSLVPLASTILTLTAAATGQPLAAVAVLAVNLERLIEACDVCQLTRQLLACVLTARASQLQLASQGGATAAAGPVPGAAGEGQQRAAQAARHCQPLLRSVPEQVDGGVRVVAAQQRRP